MHSDVVKTVMLPTADKKSFHALSHDEMHQADHYLTMIERTLVLGIEADARKQLMNFFYDQLVHLLEHGNGG